jgi:hypothetical protein
VVEVNVAVVPEGVRMPALVGLIVHVGSCGKVAPTGSGIATKFVESPAQRMTVLFETLPTPTPR